MSTPSRVVALFVTLFVLSVASPGYADTIRTGDRIQGVEVISQLDVDDLEPGKIHRFMFQGADMGTGQFYYVPVMVAKGVKPGKRALFVAGVHGDELSPVPAVQGIFAELDPTTLSGAVIGLIGVNRMGIEFVTRTWPTSNLGLLWINPNRVWPGVETGNTVERHAWLVWNGLIKGNVDVAIDYHTGGNGLDFALFAFAYADDPESMHLAELFPIDQIKADPGLEGTLEYALVKAGMPALTLELGGPRAFEPENIRAGITGAQNILSYYKMIPRPVGPTAADQNVFRGNKMISTGAAVGGFVEYLVELNDPVTKGQKVAIQRNAFGDIVYEYLAAADGRVAIIGTDAVRERDAEIISILTSDPDCPEAGCPYEGEYE